MDTSSIEAERTFYQSLAELQPDDIELRPIECPETQVPDKPSWKSLFTFTRRRHVPALTWALVTTISAGLLKPISAILLGNVFTDLTSYGSGKASAHETLHNVSIWCIAFTALGVAAWLFEGLFLSAWMVFGELQAHSVRERMFEGMLTKDMEWYDSRKDGIASLTSRIQT